MKLTKRQLKRIIKEEKARIIEQSRPPRQNNPKIEEGIWRGTHEGVWNWLEEEFDQAMTGEDVWVNQQYTESIADALEEIAREVRDRGTSA